MLDLETSLCFTLFQFKSLCKILWEDSSETGFERAVEISPEQNRKANRASTIDRPNRKCPSHDSHTLKTFAIITLLNQTPGSSFLKLPSRKFPPKRNLVTTCSLLGTFSAEKLEQIFSSCFASPHYWANCLPILDWGILAVHFIKAGCNVKGRITFIEHVLKCYLWWLYCLWWKLTARWWLALCRCARTRENTSSQPQWAFSHCTISAQMLAFPGG